jgi:hypothetical protein
VSLFETHLSISCEDSEFLLRGQGEVPWADFLLNPRRLRGSDFLMRWSQGEWSEQRLIEAVNDTGHYFALPYGPSGVAPSDDIRAFELYFERLEQAGLGEMKRPDLLILRKADEPGVIQTVAKLGGALELPFTREADPRMQSILSKAAVAVECETSLWRAAKMPDYGADLKPMARLGGRLGLRKNAVVPTVILKEEDRVPLAAWQESSRIPIHIWHVFYDMGFGLAFDKAEALIRDGTVEPTYQVFQAPGGATTGKTIYKINYRHAYLLGAAEEEPQLIADAITDKNGHILPYVKFSGGKLKLGDNALEVLSSNSRRLGV